MQVRVVMRLRRFVGIELLLALAIGLTAATAPAATITVSGEQWGVSTRYIGATEGGDGFSVADFRDLGINTYRLWAGMSRWEPEDDDGVYGSPTIAEIKADPDIIPWSVWDQAMDAVGWGGVSTRTLLESLKNAGILPVVTVRNRDNDHLPLWAPDPPSTQEDWNEWWEFVFATVYWINVRNDYRVDEWQVHNEPDNPPQGWSGTKAEYFEFVRQTADAINYVYATYLGNRSHRIYGPVNCNAYNWSDTFANVGDCLDVWDFHIYGPDEDFADQPAYAHGVLTSLGQSEKPIWVSEWGTCCANRYRDPAFANVVARCLIQGSRPGDDYVYGSHIFSMYDWGGGSWANGIIASDGPTPAYYAMRLATRALQGARPTYESTCSDENLLAITTRDQGHIYLLVNNKGDAAVPVEADLSQLAESGIVTMWQFDATHNDVIVGTPRLTGGRVSFTVPGTGTVLLKLQPVRPVLLEVHPNERAPGVGTNQYIGGQPWSQPTSSPAGSYWWKKYEFAAHGPLWIQVCAQNWDKNQKGYGDHDDTKLQVNGAAPTDYDLIQSGAPGTWQWTGGMESGQRVTLRFLVPCTPGKQTLWLGADESPALWWLKVIDLEPGIIEAF